MDIIDLYEQLTDAARAGQLSDIDLTRLHAIELAILAMPVAEEQHVYMKQEILRDLMDALGDGLDDAVAIVAGWAIRDTAIWSRSGPPRSLPESPRRSEGSETGDASENPPDLDSYR